MTALVGGGCYAWQRTLGITTIHISHDQKETSLLTDRVGGKAQGHFTRVTSGNKETS